MARQSIRYRALPDPPDDRFDIVTPYLHQIDAREQPLSFLVAQVETMRASGSGHL